MKKRIIVGISGASGAILGIRALEQIKQIPELESHLIISSAAKITITAETDWKVGDVSELADVVYLESDIGASIASGSFRTSGMLVAPCSIKTLSAISNSYADNLIVRAADVQLKEDRPVLLLLRESPLHQGHLDLMCRAANNGVIIFPPVPAFYSRPQSVDDIVDGIVGRALLRLGIDNSNYYQWRGMLNKE